MMEYSASDSGPARPVMFNKPLPIPPPPASSSPTSAPRTLLPSAMEARPSLPPHSAFSSSSSTSTVASSPQSASRNSTPRLTTTHSDVPAPDILSHFQESMPAATNIPYRPRPRSPFARSHARSHSSSTSGYRAPQMTRTQSLPMPIPISESQTHLTCPRAVSPLGASRRHRSPMRKALEDSFSSFGTDLDIDQTISENSELEVTPRPCYDNEFAVITTPSSPLSPAPFLTATPQQQQYHTFPRSNSGRRRPASPLSFSPGRSGIPTTPPSALRASTSTPSLANHTYNESYPMASATTTSSASFASTPTSIRSRSRSPSISSLETIPDTPDAEKEAEKIARHRLASAVRDMRSEAQDDHPAFLRRRLSINSDGTSRMGGSGRDKRKRWSVCGAERRGDLDLETIWEDGS